MYNKERSIILTKRSFFMLSFYYLHRNAALPNQLKTNPEASVLIRPFCSIGSEMFPPIISDISSSDSS